MRSQFADVTSFTLDGESYESITPYEIHPGIIKGVYNVKNIQETAEIDAYTNTNDFER